MIAASPLIHRFLPCLLAICIAMMGPSVLAGLPRAVNSNTEEETRTQTEHAVGNVISSIVRPAKSHADRGKVRPGRLQIGMLAVQFDRMEDCVAARSLRSLQVRIQV